MGVTEFSLVKMLMAHKNWEISYAGWYLRSSYQGKKMVPRGKFYDHTWKWYLDFGLVAVVMDFLVIFLHT